MCQHTKAVRKALELLDPKVEVSLDKKCATVRAPIWTTRR